ncbi:hypothetical protein ACXX9E_29625 [Pseudomonas sp. GNP014]
MLIDTYVSIGQSHCHRLLSLFSEMNCGKSLSLCFDVVVPDLLLAPSGHLIRSRALARVSTAKKLARIRADRRRQHRADGRYSPSVG